MSERGATRPEAGQHGAAATAAQANTRRLRVRRASSVWWRAVVTSMLLAVVLVLLVGAPSRSDLRAARAREAELREEITKTQRRIHQLEEQRERLLHDPVLLERLAREELGWARPQDVVVVLPDGAP